MQTTGSAKSHRRSRAVTLWTGFLAAAAVALGADAAVYHVDANGGDDRNPGTTPAKAWATLEKASARKYTAGDRVLLRRGGVFRGKLKLDQARGTAAKPVTVAAYGEGDRPVIDASGYLAGVHLANCRHVEVRDLTITADGGAPVDGSKATERYGVLATTFGKGRSQGLTLEDLRIHTIYPHEPSENEGANPTTYVGKAIRISGRKEHPYRDIRIEGCAIENTGHAVLQAIRTQNLRVLNNRMENIGGPAMVPNRCDDLVVRGNTVDRSGASTDKRMHGRGSGIWPIHCERVLIEHNRFMHARGRYDSCGAHIDIGNRNVVVQYNLSLDNEGGFVEILGENFNCAYRYNVSVNDGARVANPDKKQGAGHVILFSGHNGKEERAGPTHCYVYNNTIFVRRGQRASFSIEDTTDRVLVANNVFYFRGRAENGTPAWRAKYPQGIERGVVWKNNLYRRRNDFPTDWPFREIAPIVKNPELATPGGFEPEDYRPAPGSIVKDRGIEIERLPGDNIGLAVGLAVEKDFFGAPIVGRPDLGAIEVASSSDSRVGDKEEPVTLTDKRGRAIEARVLHVDGQYVYARLAKGRTHAIPLTRLDEPSRRLTAAWKKRHGARLNEEQSNYLRSLRERLP